MERIVKLGIIGCGGIANSKHMPALKKMEDVATNNIKTIVNTNTVFIDELYKTKSDSDGFKHDMKSGNQCQLNNGSSIQAIAGASRSARGRRSNVNIYDEAGFITKDTYD